MYPAWTRHTCMCKCAHVCMYIMCVYMYIYIYIRVYIYTSYYVIYIYMIYLWISREYTNHYTCVLRNRLYARDMVCITGLCLQKAFEDELGVPCPRIRVLDFTGGPCWSSLCCFTCIRKQNAVSWVEQFGQFVSGAFRKLYTVVTDFIWFYGYLDIWIFGIIWIGIVGHWLVIFV